MQMLKAPSNILSWALWHRRHEVSRGLRQILMLLQTALLAHAAAAAYCISTVELVFPWGARVLMYQGTGVCKDILQGCSYHAMCKGRPYEGFKTVNIARLWAQTGQSFLVIYLHALLHGTAFPISLQCFLLLQSVRKETEVTADLTHN